MRLGYIKLLGHIVRCLRDGQIPTKNNIRAMCRKEEADTKKLSQGYLKNGGTIASAMLPIFRAAVRHDEILGDCLH